MREIKFRAWDGKTMFEPSQITFAEAGWHVDEGRGVSIPYQPHITLMQYTGLKDKNGVEIWEGDIVNVDNSIPAQPFGDNPDPGEPRFIQSVVTFSDASFRCQTDEFGNVALDRLVDETGPIEVIGNIWEDPELLESKK